MNHGKDVPVIKGQDRFSIFGNPNMSVDITTQRHNGRNNNNFNKELYNSIDLKLRTNGIPGISRPPAIAVKFENI
jgi:hypothetical protein